MNFLTNIDALRNFVEVLLPVAVEHDTQEHSRVMDDMHSLMLAAGFTEDQIGRKDGELGAPENPPTLDREAMMSRLAPIFRRLLPLVTVPKPETLYRSAFVMLNCHFDHLIAGLITHYYDTFPDALSGKDTSLTLADLKSCSNIEDARGMIVSKVVRSITGESLGVCRRTSAARNEMAIPLSNSYGYPTLP